MTMTKRELQEHLLRLWLDGKSLPTIQRKVSGDWVDIHPVLGVYKVPVLGDMEYRIKPKEYKVDQPVWVKLSKDAPWYPRHYAEFKKYKHYVWPNGRTSFTQENDWPLDVVEITDEDPNG